MAGTRPCPDADVIERGGGRISIAGWAVLRWRPPRAAVILGAAGLAAGLGAGYATGASSGGHAAAPGSTAPVPSPGSGLPALSQSGPACSAQVGQDLQLGIEVSNELPVNLLLSQVRVVLPIGGLRILGQSWGPCGALPMPAATPANVIPAGGSTWVTVTFQVLVNCPQALPVQFAIGYSSHGKPGTVQLPGFSDLSQIPYGQCQAGTPPDGTTTG